MTKVEIGAATLYLGDCREILPTLPKADAVVTDPPYGLGIAANPVRQAHSRQDWDDQPIGEKDVLSLLEAGTEQIIWGGNYFHLKPSQGFLIWDKVQPEGLTLAQVEYAWFSRQQPAKLFTRRVIGYQKEHPTQKPVELMEWCLSFLPSARSILDPYMGAGTTGVACVRQGRDFVGIEREPKYFDVACKRIEQAYREPGLFEIERHLAGVKQSDFGLVP